MLFLIDLKKNYPKLKPLMKWWIICTSQSQQFIKPPPGLARNAGTALQDKMKRSGFKWKPRKPLKRTPLRPKSKSYTATIKDDIQCLLRVVVTLRDGGCILRNYRHCGGDASVEVIDTGNSFDYKVVSDVVIQADHLVTRANSATYADHRLVVCLCRPCHGWKHFNEKEYDALVKRILPKDRVELWDKCETERQSHRSHKPNWILEVIALRQEIKKLST